MTIIEQHELRYLPLNTQDDGKLKLNTTSSMSKWKTKGLNLSTFFFKNLNLTDLKWFKEFYFYYFVIMMVVPYMFYVTYGLGQCNYIFCWFNC